MLARTPEPDRRWRPIEELSAAALEANAGATVTFRVAHLWRSRSVSISGDCPLGPRAALSAAIANGTLGFRPSRWRREYAPGKGALYIGFRGRAA